VVFAERVNRGACLEAEDDSTEEDDSTKKEGAVPYDLIPGPGRIPGVPKVHALHRKAFLTGSEEEPPHGHPAASLVMTNPLRPKLLDGSSGEGIQLVGLGVGQVVTQVRAHDDEGRTLRTSATSSGDASPTTRGTRVKSPRATWRKGR